MNSGFTETANAVLACECLNHADTAFDSNCSRSSGFIMTVETSNIAQIGLWSEILFSHLSYSTGFTFPGYVASLFFHFALDL